VALQGDLSSFALPDVLRLLAGTAKSGRLAVSAPPASGEVWMRDGGVAGGVMTTAPRADSATDILFEMLRLAEGSFVFEDDEDMAETRDAQVTSVDDALVAAEALVAEWVEVEAVVPSMDAWVAFAAEIDGDEVTVSAESWRTLAVIGNGGTVDDIADALELTDLAASRQVKVLVESGMATVRMDHAMTRHEAEVPVEEMEVGEPEPFDPEPFDPDALQREIYDELDVLRSEDRPVVMESSEDALLPEPLPGEGVSYAADSIGNGAVDGRGYDAIDHETPYAHEAVVEPVPMADATAPDELEVAAMAEAFGAAESMELAGDEDDEADFDAEDEDDDADGTDEATAQAETTFFGDVPRHDFHGKGHRGITSLEEELAADDPDAPAPEPAPEPMSAADQQEEDDRGSLLKFLSSVQP
jgi:hypothetical protein